MELGLRGEEMITREYCAEREIVVMWYVRLLGCVMVSLVRRAGTYTLRLREGVQKENR